MIGYYLAAYLGGSTVFGLGLAWLFKYCMRDPGVALIAGIASLGKCVYIALVSNVLLLFFSQFVSQSAINYWEKKL